MENEGPESKIGGNEEGADGNVVRFPREWLGPLEELVPLDVRPGSHDDRKPAAESEPEAGRGHEPDIADHPQPDAAAGVLEFAGAPPPRAEDFWGEASAAVHDALQAPPLADGEPQGTTSDPRSDRAVADEPSICSDSSGRRAGLRLGMRMCSEAMRRRMRRPSGPVSQREQRSSFPTKSRTKLPRVPRPRALPVLAMAVAVGVAASAVGLVRLTAAPTAGRARAPQASGRRSDPFLAAISGAVVLTMPAHHAPRRSRRRPAGAPQRPHPQNHEQQSTPVTAARSAPTVNGQPGSEPVSTYSPAAAAAAPSASPAASPSAGGGTSTPQSNPPSGPTGPGATFGPGKMG